MNILLWVLQILLALHTLIGALWKFSNSAAQAAPSLSAIPQGVWLAMSAFEILCSLGLILPAFNKRLAILTPIAAAGVAAEMLIFCALQLRSGDPDYGPMIYWLVVTTVCAFIACGRLVLKPFPGSGLVT
jgi:hypothetical protein